MIFGTLGLIMIGDMDVRSAETTLTFAFDVHIIFKFDLVAWKETSHLRGISSPVLHSFELSCSV